MVQDVLLRLWQMRDQLRMPIEPLARVLTRNRCIDIARRKKPAAELSMAVFQEEDEALRERIERMMKVIETLPDLQQTILRLRHMEGMEFEDIALRLGLQAATVRVELSRARKRVREIYQQRKES